jgi:hypothetical protein
MKAQVKHRTTPVRGTAMLNKLTKIKMQGSGSTRDLLERVS